MPLVAHSSLPTFAQLREQGHDVLSVGFAERQDIRELHVGFLNMMPDAALKATERQFIRLVGSCNRIAQFYVHPFSLPELNRGPEAQAYVDAHYERFENLQEQGLDALIISGANVETPKLELEAFWSPLVRVVEWAETNVASILCSCLASHALWQHLHGLVRAPLPTGKRWGVFQHRLARAPHPLLRDLNTRFDVPHSRYNDVPKAAIEGAGLKVLAENELGEVHLAVSPDQIRVVYFQGHPEYDANSLLKEYRREVRRHAKGERDAPPHPVNYFPGDAQETVASMARDVFESARAEDASDKALEAAVAAQLDNTWGDTAKAMFNNWLGLVYQLTNLDRRQQFMPGVDPEDPLQLRKPRP
ncbi:MAG: homoserine O-succinyltransferase [Myxococcota bacterium]